MDVRLDIMQWAVCVQLISSAAVSYFQSALNSGMVGHHCALVSLDLECQAHDAYLPIHFSWWSAAVEVVVSIPPKVNP